MKKSNILLNKEKLLLALLKLVQDVIAKKKKNHPKSHFQGR